jgi:hypothetical protein
MPVSSPLPTDTRSRVADWLEVTSLASPRNVATRSDLLGLYDLLDEDGHALERDEVSGEYLEVEILEDSRAESADVVLEELTYRASVLGDFYPFKIELRGQNWRLVLSPEVADTENQAARACYTFCLLTSAIRDRCIQGIGVVSLERTLPNHFQAIAAEAAAGVLGGDVVSFGWPRPAGTGFLPALHDMARRLRIGTPRETAPLWSNNREKDAGIDVIAWRDFSDVRPGKLVLFGQVASGNNWTEKSVKSDTPRFLSWFSEHPTKHYIPAIFIPFPQHHACAGRYNAGFEAVAQAEAWLREQEFGLVVDRLRIVGVAAKRLIAQIDAGGRETLDAVGGWNVDALTVARAAA